MEGAASVNDQVRLVGGASLDLPDRRGNEAVAAFNQGKGARADEGEVDLAFPQELIDLPISFSRHEIQVFPGLAGYVGQKLPVVDKGPPGERSGLPPAPGASQATQRRASTTSILMGVCW